MTTLRLALPLSFVACIALACGETGASEESPTATHEEEAEEEDEDVPVPLEEVPKAALDAALAAVPGLEIVEAELEEDGNFELKGLAAGIPTEVEVDAEGNVIEIDTGDDDEDDDDDEEEEEHGHDH